MMIRLPRFAFFGLVSLALTGSPAHAQNEGQDQLDRAIEAKLSAESLADLEGVIQLCKDALAAGLDDANTRFATRLLASTLIQRGWAISRQVLERPLDDLQSLRQMARLRQIALTDLEQALQHDAEQSQAHLLIGRLHGLPGGNRQRAFQALDEAIRLSAEDDSMLAQALAARAPLQEDVAKQREDFDRAVELAAGNPEILRSRAQFHAAQKSLDAALADIDVALELEPDHAPTYEARGAVLAGLNKPDEAVESLAESIELDPGRPSPYLRRARIYMAKNELEKALADLDEALDLRDDLLTALFFRSAVHREMGNQEKALADAARLREMAPRLPSARRLWMQLMGENGQLDDAIADLEQYREEQQEPDADLLVDMATLYLMKRDYEGAIDLYSQIIAAHPENANIYKLRADAKLYLGQQAEAVADYEATLKLRPEDTSVLNNLAWLLATSTVDDLRDGQRSIELATEACELTEYEEAHILSTLASGYAEIGDFDAAIEWSTKAVEQGNESLKGALQKELDSYQQGKPWRESAPPQPQLGFELPDESGLQEDVSPPPDPDEGAPAEREEAEGSEPAEEPSGDR